MKMANMISILHVLIGATAFASLAETVYVFHSDLPIALQINGEVWIQKVSEFSISDRGVVFSLVELSEAAWFWTLYNMWCLAGLYRRGQYFTPQNSQCFLRIGYALIVMAVLDTLLVPALSGYLYYRGITEGLVDMDIALIVSELDLMTAGLFFLLIGAIMDKASNMQEEAEMTI
ncbi:DUF2975 domain-containing protein [Leisingera sp. ANG-DT]|uniref:DUF2975 domain-containing protein n=1 Tax=Leisingera sp. ANG-DT TaxID=1577897 RepID=UPI0005831911|nr:DUF2975 domain-containing protein [Leisingera sp. ANG-DT]KIC13644.1 hypothetical protein RA21_21520 [Leisingera sp. ANG-DT]